MAIHMYLYTDTWNSGMCMCNNCKDVILRYPPFRPSVYQRPAKGQWSLLALPENYPQQSQ